MDTIEFETYYEKFRLYNLKFNCKNTSQLEQVVDMDSEEDEDDILYKQKILAKEFIAKFRFILPKNNQTCLDFLFECSPLKRNLMSFYLNEDHGKFQKVFIAHVPKSNLVIDETLFLAEFYHFFKISKDLDAGLHFSGLFFDFLLNDFGHFPLSSKFKEMLNQFSQIDCLLWLFTLSRFVIESGAQTSINVENFHSIMSDKRDFIRFRFELKNHPLIINDYWELTDDEFFYQESSIRITEKSIDCIFPEWGLLSNKKTDKKTNSEYTLYPPELLIKEEMIYNEGDEIKQVNRLMKILNNISIDKLNNTRCGILLHGAPGTGKTLLSKMICAELGYHLMEVNSAAIESKYVGDTSKAIDRLFKAYEMESKNKKVCLVIQEMDSLMGKRVQIERSSDHFMNQAQTQLLLNLDNFKGLLIGTTNQFNEGSMDPAFFRRFLFKIEVKRPTFATRQQLWQSKLPPHLKENQRLIDELSLFDLTGANIDNIVLKAELINSLADESFFSELLLELAIEESESDCNSKVNCGIGFQRFAS